jgi:hypothetical protein
VSKSVSAQAEGRFTPKATRSRWDFRLDNRDAFLWGAQEDDSLGPRDSEARWEAGQPSRSQRRLLFGIEEETMDTMRCTFG